MGRYWPSPARGILKGIQDWECYIWPTLLGFMMFFLTNLKCNTALFFAWRNTSHKLNRQGASSNWQGSWLYWNHGGILAPWIAGCRCADFPGPILPGSMDWFKAGWLFQRFFIFHFIYGMSLILLLNLLWVIPGWWFGTWNLFLYMGCHPSHWRTHISQDGHCTTNQKGTTGIEL